MTVSDSIYLFQKKAPQQKLKNSFSFLVVKMDILSELPTDITYSMLGYLGPKVLFQCRLVSSGWNNLINTVFDEIKRFFVDGDAISLSKFVSSNMFVNTTLRGVISINKNNPGIELLFIPQRANIFIADNVNKPGIIEDLIVASKQKQSTYFVFTEADGIYAKFSVDRGELLSFMPKQKYGNLGIFPKNFPPKEYKHFLCDDYYLLSFGSIILDMECSMIRQYNLYDMILLQAMIDGDKCYISMKNRSKCIDLIEKQMQKCFGEHLVCGEKWAQYTAPLRYSLRRTPLIDVNSRPFTLVNGTVNYRGRQYRSIYKANERCYALSTISVLCLNVIYRLPGAKIETVIDSEKLSNSKGRKGYKVIELKDICTKLGLPKTGRKIYLVEMLLGIKFP